MPIDRVLDLARRVGAARDPSPRTRRVLLSVGLVAFVVMLVVSLRDLEVDAGTLAWGPLALAALVLVPLTILGNAAELRVMAATVAPGALTWSEAVRAVVLATAANLLPIPGAALVRIQALRTRGASGVAATGINLAGAGAWIGSGLVVAGVALTPLRGPLALGVAGVGLLGCVVAGLLVRRFALPGRMWRGVLALTAVELAVTVTHGLRLLVVLAALQVELSLPQALVVGLGAPLSAAAGVFPSGIGLAEALAGLLAPVVALPAAVGVAATGVNRIVGLAVTTPLAGLLAARSPVERPRTDAG
ncbi:hypothetical protein [Egicoccus halophilus]|uniref:Lysylphosphatidylglycerol synthase TM region n=1 Tax=Egicoccus halophilus TaxID=1670830 RepID=A0A8J3AES1_9ACTN|nr:hypothetical protein [Egicoccus halophilus]GGI05945.1 hypothetical protein GCM10011354_16640 [Egicoccus halophilus]